jgi:hypothetical protein
MEIRVVAPVGQDGLNSFSDRALAPKIASSASQASAPAIGAELTRLDQVSAWRSPACGRPSQSEPGGSESAGTCRPPAKEEGSMQALTLPVELIDRGDVVAVGQRFYRVDSVVQPRDRFGFALIVLRSLETGSYAAIEFRNSAAAISVLRFPTMLRWASRTAVRHSTPPKPRPSGGPFD